MSFKVRLGAAGSFLPLRSVFDGSLCSFFCSSDAGDEPACLPAIKDLHGALAGQAWKWSLKDPPSPVIPPPPTRRPWGSTELSRRRCEMTARKRVWEEKQRLMEEESARVAHYK